MNTIRYGGWISTSSSTLPYTLINHTHTPCIITHDNPTCIGYGWEHAITLSDTTIPTIIVDNHHHVLPRWAYRSSHTHTSRIVVLHIDAHADLGNNPHPCPSLIIPRSKQHAHKRWSYSYKHCSIATFITPLLASHTITDCIQIRTRYTLSVYADSLPQENTAYILDIDCDFWDKQGRNNDQKQSLTAITSIIQTYPLIGISIASSPIFLDQTLAKDIIINIVTNTIPHT